MINALTTVSAFGSVIEVKKYYKSNNLGLKWYRNLYVLRFNTYVSFHLFYFWLKNKTRERQLAGRVGWIFSRRA